MSHVHKDGTIYAAYLMMGRSLTVSTSLCLMEGAMLPTIIDVVFVENTMVLRSIAMKIVVLHLEEGRNHGFTSHVHGKQVCRFQQILNMF
jgi:hypothetical protein